VWSVDVDRGFAQGVPELVHRNMGRMWLKGLTDAGSYFYYVTVGAVDVYEAELADGAVRNPVTLPNSYSGSNISSIWSPDGRRLAYASRRGLIGFDRGSTTLAVRDLQSQEQREFIPAMNTFLVRSWSPDGRLVAVQGMDPAGREGAYAIDTDNGRVTPILMSDQIARLDYLSDGRVVYFDRAKNALLAGNVQTGAEHVLVDLRAEGIELTAGVAGRGFKLSPDGQMLAYTSVIREGENGTRLLAIKVLGGGPARELARASGPEMLVFQDWTPDGATVLFTRWNGKPNDARSLWRVSIHGGNPQPLGLTMDGLRDVSVHPHGTKMTFTAGWPMNELWVMEHFLTNK
jgi:Tol biopolymer transport system component